jgi:murein DD-endopeptidase MepM/ murein hydrolase activator NlpD
MTLPANASKARFLGRVAVVALLAGFSAGCSADIERFAGFGIPFEQPPNQSAMVTGSVTPAPTGPVTTGALPPPPVSTAVQTAPIAAPAGVASVPPAATAVPAVAAPVAAAASGGEVYVVKSGDSLGRIANDRGLRSIDVATYNGIDPAAPIKVGQQLRIPPAGKPVTQVAAVQPGTTATDAGGSLGTVPAQPTAAPAQAQLPATAQTPAAQAAAAPGTPAPAQPQPTGETQVAVAPAAPAQPQVATGAGVESSTTGNFRWPVRGRVISGFGVKANGARNDGINIEVPEGTPIKAAEGGTVIYAGNELKGYGNLVLVKHPNGMVSAYAHASELLVKRDDVVMRGQTLGKVGATGNVERPQLHFEIRQGNKPVDPIPYLSG